MVAYDFGKITSELKEINKIKEYSLKILSSSENYIKMVFEMTINQAIVENSFTRYKIAGRKIEDMYWKYMEDTSLALLEE